jgi:hypothetical protein
MLTDTPNQGPNNILYPTSLLWSEGRTAGQKLPPGRIVTAI